MVIAHPGDLVGAAISGLLVLLAVATLGMAWNSRLPAPRGRHYLLVAAVALAAAVLATIGSYICNIRWS